MAQSGRHTIRLSLLALAILAGLALHKVDEKTQAECHACVEPAVEAVKS
ncbi:MAG: hypothetical protein AAGF30_03055 [Pseudomonadota bacterium]